MSITSLPEPVIKYFPYNNVRPYQDRFIKIIYDCVDARSHLAMEGANGLGKTIAVLSAALPIAKERGLRILYCARTHKQMDRVIEELSAIHQKVDVSGISIRGRLEMCFHPLITRHASDAKAAMEICDQLKQRDLCPFYENLGRKAERCGEIQLTCESKPFMATEILEIRKREEFCPYELTKLCIGQVDVVALSYIYAFDPVIRSGFFKYLNKPLNDFILILDEAHNLPEIATEIASDQLTLFAIRQAQKEAKKYGDSEIEVFCRSLERIVEKISEPVKEEAPVNPVLLLETIKDEARVDELLNFFDHIHGTGNIIRKKLLAKGRYPHSFLHRVGEFLLNWLRTSADPAFTHVTVKYEAKSGVTSSKLEIVSLEPRRIIAPITSSVYCTISISGTLEPLESFIKITGLPDSTYCEAVPSPFPEEHILPLACVGVTTSLNARTPKMYKRIVKKIAEIVRYTPANVGVFTASFDVLEGLIEADLEAVISKPILREQRGMSSKDNDRLVSRFRSYADRGGAVLLGVEGGRSSEGADFPGKQMESVAIVGVPYMEPTPRVNAQIQYYESQFPGHGHEYGYLVPALRKAAQAAGRSIRTLEDRSAIILLDYRFSTKYCRRYLPLWIRKNMKTVLDEDGAIAKELILFFGFGKT